MVKNSGKGGKKHKKGKNSFNTATRELVTKEEQEEYAIIASKMGNCRFKLQCFDKKERMGILRGNMRGRNYLQLGDLVLISLREFQDEKADIVHKYRPNEAKRLKSIGQIPKDTKILENEELDGNDDVEFDDSDDEPEINIRGKNNKTQKSSEESEESIDSIDIEDI